jgi:multidrug efflux pump subunit AcrA (membrane-fusion protein)
MQMQILPGQKIEAGQKLMTIVDPSTIWLQVNVFETDYYGMSEPTGIYLTVPGRDSGISVGPRGMRLLSVGSAIDPENRTIPVLLEIANPDLLLKINQSIDVELYFGGTEPALCVPKGAVFDDDAHDVVFVHTEGESFAKREVTVGAHDDGWVSILSGLEEGERIVTRGGYHVKLATTSVETGHGHGH